jgi:hypothetical protein
MEALSKLFSLRDHWRKGSLKSLRMRLQFVSADAVLLRRLLLPRRFSSTLRRGLLALEMEEMMWL